MPAPCGGWWFRPARGRGGAAAAHPDDLWKRTLVRYPFLQRQAARARPELRRLTSLFLDRKEFSVPPVRLTDDVVVAVAAQACLPVLRLGLHRYDGFVGIVLHPDQVVARREQWTTTAWCTSTTKSCPARPWKAAR
jgi:Mlc titration factor MtfA (ptsG expression regulator)